MRILFLIVFLMPVLGFFPIWSTASPSSLQDNNKPISRTLSKRNVYFETVEELLSEVSILQLRVKHVQTELHELKGSVAGGKKCQDLSQFSKAECNANVLQELDAAIRNLKEELRQESSKSGEISKGVESLREEMDEYFYKIDDLGGFCQKNGLKITDNTYDIENINITVNEIKSRFSKEVEAIKKCMKATCGSTSKRSIGAPSYISKWFHMKAYDSNNKWSKVIIEHGLNELPVKVDVQVKSMSGADNDWIFTGASATLADDDTGEDYGGAVYFYNETHVILSVPVASNTNKRQGYVVTTGHRNEYFIGSHHYKYNEGLVRIRIWLPYSFPTPSYSSQWHALNIADADKSFHTIRHGLSSYPALVTVQVRSQNMISEAVGSSLHFKVTSRYSNGGGVVYGVDDRMVRIWTAYVQNTSHYGYGSLFGDRDGWATTIPKTILGEFRVTVWGSESFDDNNSYLRESNIMETDTGALSMPEIDIDNDLVSFHAQALDGPNQGFLFNGWGSSQAVLAPFGGVIYAYNKQGQFQTWRPNPKNQGYLININSPYGNGRNIQSSNSASYIAKLLKAEK